MSAKLGVRGLGFAYENRQILRDISFDVQEGELVALLGPSGCGKSTILNLIAGLITPQAGSIWVDGRQITGRSERFAYMPQDDLLFPWLTVLKNVCLYGRLHGTQVQARRRALERMPAFGLAGCENLYPSALSGGMRQRAAFLRTSLCNADILLLDEPFGALDVISRGDMQDWLLAMRGEWGKTALLVTHDIDEALYLSDRILVLGCSPAGVAGVFEVKRKIRTREWLYAQSEMRAQIYRCIKSHQALWRAEEPCAGAKGAG